MSLGKLEIDIYDLAVPPGHEVTTTWIFVGAPEDFSDPDYRAAQHDRLNRILDKLAARSHDVLPGATDTATASLRKMGGSK